MTTLNRKLLREIRGHLGTLLAVTGIIAVGVACLVALASSYLNLSEAKTLYYAECRMADFSIELKKAPLAALAKLAEMPEVGLHQSSPGLAGEQSQGEFFSGRSGRR